MLIENKENSLYELLETEFQNTNNNLMNFGKEESETVIKKLFSITIEWKEKKLNFDLIASKFLWNGKVFLNLEFHSEKRRFLFFNYFLHKISQLIIFMNLYLVLIF